MLIISCHADTNFKFHMLEHLEDGVIHGHLDNFAGVHAVMTAYFSGRINAEHVRIELTYGEEVDFAGAYEVLEDVQEDDMVIVVDVTGYETEAEFTVEKCYHPDLQDFIFGALDDLSFEMFDDSPDPISNADETDVYVEGSPLVCFFGIPCWGGDYNEGPVYCYESSIEAVAEAICRLAEAYGEFKPSAENEAAAD